MSIIKSSLDLKRRHGLSSTMRTRWWLIILTFLPGLIRAQGTPTSFNRDIRGLLSNYCFTCHGPDEKSRKADLRLDLRETAVASAWKCVTSPGSRSSA